MFFVYLWCTKNKRNTLCYQRAKWRRFIAWQTISASFQRVGGHRCLKYFYLGYVCKHRGHLFPKTVS